MAKPKDSQLFGALAMVGHLGILMTACILLGFFAGLYLDGLLKTGMAFTVILMLAGIAGGMLACYKVVMKAAGTDDKRDTGNER